MEGCVGERRHTGKYRQGLFGVLGRWECCRSEGVDARGCVVTTSAFLQEIGDIYLKSGNYDKAVEVYFLAVFIDSASHTAYVKHSNAYINMGNALLAIRDGQMCLVLKPTLH